NSGKVPGVKVGATRAAGKAPVFSQRPEPESASTITGRPLPRRCRRLTVAFSPVPENLMPHCLLLCSLFLITSADAPKPDAAKALAVVVKGFNDGEDPKELHALLTKDFQKDLPLPALRAVLQKVWRHYGKIVGEPASIRA